MMASPDYYQVLGISRKATAREIRRAYRALARKFHPDFNPGDGAALQKFREIREAYEVLSSSRKRKAYDYYGPDFGLRIPTKSFEETGPPSYPALRSRSDSFRYGAPADPTNRPVRSGSAWPDVITALGGRAVFALFFVGFAFLYFLWPDSKVKEFKLARQALQQVHSWKMEIRGVDSDSNPARYLDEVSCPSSERVTHHVMAKIDGQPTELTLGTATIGNKHYYHDVHARNWVPDGMVVTRAGDSCARLSQWFPFNEWLGSQYAIEKQGVREAGDGRCREWKIVTLGAPSSGQFVCLGLIDRLPRFQGAPNNPEERRFYDWNVPIHFQPPGLDGQ